MRKPIIAGNWKMHNTIEEAVALVEDLKSLVKNASCEVVVCPTFVCLPAVVEAAKGTNIKVGAQNMYFEEKGAFTGEVAPIMLESLGVDYVIIGHSERRQYFNETDETVNKKLKKAYEHKLIPILCVGETLEEREGNITSEVLGRQVKLDVAGLTKTQIENLIIAYEPIWAIGTGKTATADDANNTIAYIRKVVAGIFRRRYSRKSKNSVRRIC